MLNVCHYKKVFINFSACSQKRQRFVLFDHQIGQKSAFELTEILFIHNIYLTQPFLRSILIIKFKWSFYHRKLPAVTERILQLISFI